jgi:hypothetical protein
LGIGASYFGYQAGFNDAKSLVENSGIGNVLRTPDDIRTLSGVVTAIGGDRIAMHIQSVNPFDDQTLNDRTILITADTKIVKLVQKDQKAFQSEMDTFIKATASNKNIGTEPPQPFTRVAADIASITANDFLMVTSLENIKTLKEFTASEIQISSRPPLITLPQ